MLKKMIENGEKPDDNTIRQLLNSGQITENDLKTLQNGQQPR